MANITVRNIPDGIFEKIKSLSLVERRSINSEILMILEKGVLYEFESYCKDIKHISKDSQVNIWENLCGKWEDSRETTEIIKDIYGNRTTGRKINL